VDRLETTRKCLPEKEWDGIAMQLHFSGAFGVKKIYKDISE